MPTALLVISDREPLAWLLRERRFAVPAGRMSTAPGAGTRLLLYTTRGCYRNPTRDWGLIMGIGTVTSDAALLHEPVTFRERDFLAGFGVEIDGVAPPHEGVDLGSYAGRIDALPDERHHRVMERAPAPQPCPPVSERLTDVGRRAQTHAAAG